jgi:hypothetical protein
MSARNTPTFFFYLFHGYHRVRAWMLLITMMGMIFLVSLSLFNYLNVYGQSADFKVMVTTADGKVHDLNVKASQGANGQVIPISGFVIDPEDVMQVKQGQNLVVMTSTNEPLRIDKVKAVDQAGKFIELSRLSPNEWSLQNLAVGVYLLDVIVDSPTSNSATAYETILAILGPNQKPLPPAQYITYVTVETDFEWVFKEDKCSNQAGSAGMGFPYQNVSECEVEGEEDCRKNKIDSDYCEGLKERFRDDCDGFANAKECEDYWNRPPLCDENTPPGQTCYDEGDPDTCEPGFVDRGFGCEAEGVIPPPEIPIFGDEDTSAGADEDESVGEDEGSDTRAEEGEDDSGDEFEGGDDNESGGGDEEDSSSGGEDESAGDEEGSTFG